MTATGNINLINGKSQERSNDASLHLVLRLKAGPQTEQVLVEEYIDIVPSEPTEKPNNSAKENIEAESPQVTEEQGVVDADYMDCAPTKMEEQGVVGADYMDYAPTKEEFYLPAKNIAQEQKFSQVLTPTKMFYQRNNESPQKTKKQMFNLITTAVKQIGDNSELQSKIKTLGREIVKRNQYINNISQEFNRERFANTKLQQTNQNLQLEIQELQQENQTLQQENRRKESIIIRKTKECGEIKEELKSYKTKLKQKKPYLNESLSTTSTTKEKPKTKWQPKTPVTNTNYSPQTINMDENKGIENSSGELQSVEIFGTRKKGKEAIIFSNSGHRFTSHRPQYQNSTNNSNFLRKARPQNPKR